jgi:hypothetical protein
MMTLLWHLFALVPLGVALAGCMVLLPLARAGRRDLEDLRREEDWVNQYVYRCRLLEEAGREGHHMDSVAFRYPANGVRAEMIRPTKEARHTGRASALLDIEL